MIDIRSFQTTSELTAGAARDIAEIIGQTLHEKDRATLALTGGTLGIQILSDLQHQGIDFSKVDLYFGDERFVALDHPDRNEQQAIDAWPALSNLNLHRYPATGMPLDAAADFYEREVSAHFGELADCNESFDIAILGMGPDGHVASLFPNRNHDKRWIVAEHNSPKPPSQRLSFSYEALNLSRNVFFLASSAAKYDAVKCALKDPACELPAAKVKGLDLTRWYLDEEISRGL